MARLPAIALGCVALLAGAAAGAADAARGAQLYMRTDDDVRSCVSCHGPDPGLSHNNILRAADNPATLAKVLNTVSQMGFLRARLSDADHADVAAFLGTVARLNAPSAAMKVWPVTMDFGAVAVGGVSAAQTVRISNSSQGTHLSLTSIKVVGGRPN